MPCHTTRGKAVQRLVEDLLKQQSADFIWSVHEGPDNLNVYVKRYDREGELVLEQAQATALSARDVERIKEYLSY